MYIYQKELNLSASNPPIWHWSRLWYKAAAGGEVYSFVGELNIHFSLFPGSGVWFPRGHKETAPVTSARGALINPGTMLCGGCSLLFLAGLVTGNVNWFGSDKDPTVQVPGHFVGTQIKYSGWISVRAGFTKSQDKLLFSFSFWPISVV